jgi:hypothetical protein
LGRVTGGGEAGVGEVVEGGGVAGAAEATGEFLVAPGEGEGEDAIGA